MERLDRLAHARGQLIDVEPVGDEREAGVGAHDPLDAEHPAQSGHEHAHLLGRPRRQIGVPQCVGERRRRHRRATGDGEHLERGPRLATPERRVGDALDDEATEEADTQRAGRATVLPELASLAHRLAMLGRRRAAPGAIGAGSVVVELVEQVVGDLSGLAGDAALVLELLEVGVDHAELGPRPSTNDTLPS